MGIVFEFRQNLIDILQIRQLDERLQLLNLDVKRILELAVENSRLVLEDRGPLLNDDVNASDCDVLDFGSVVHQRNEGRRHLPANRSNLLCVCHEI